MNDVRAEFPLDVFWSVEPQAFARMLDVLRSQNPVESLRLPAQVANALPLETLDGVAVISIDGVMTKRPSLMQVLFGGASTEQIQRAVEQAADDDDVHAILLRADSPGGSVAGLAELGDAVHAARQRKTVYAQTTGLNASACYYVTSQAEKVFAQRMDLVGSIGTRMMLYDVSRFFANAGVEAIPIDTGEFKSAGAFGTEITEDHKSYFQEIVDSFFGDFLATIERGRGMPRAALEAVADGRIFAAQTAAGVGLIDGLQTFSQTLAQLQQRAKPSPRRHAMKSAETQQQQATLSQLRDACPGANNDFLIEQLDAGATVAAAQHAWMQEQQLQIEALEEQAARPTGPANTPTGGVKPLGTPRQSQPADEESSGFEGDPVAEFNARVAAKIKSGVPRRTAVQQVAAADTALHEAFLLATNPGRRKQSLVRERFEMLAE